MHVRAAAGKAEAIRRAAIAALAMLLLASGCSNPTNAASASLAPTPAPSATPTSTPLPHDSGVTTPPETPPADNTTQLELEPGASIIYDSNGDPIAVFREEFLPVPDAANLIGDTAGAEQYFILDLARGFIDGSLLATTQFDFAARVASTEEERINALFSEGLHIFTTYDPETQALALQARDEIAALTATAADDTGIALVSMHPGSGAVRALVGGPSVDVATLNMATQVERRLGSGFDPFVLISSFESGYVPNDTISGTAPCTSREVPAYSVANRIHEPSRSATLRQHLAAGSRCAFLRLGELTETAWVLNTTQRLGLALDYPGDPTPGLVTGNVSATPIDLAVAHSTIANLGVERPPYFIERIESADGRLLYVREPNGIRRVASNAACLAIETLNFAASIGSSAQLEIEGQPAAGVAGSTESFEDAWFAGFTPYLTTVVWMGNLTPGEPLVLLDGAPVTGKSLPEQAWVTAMQGYHAELPARPLPTCEPTRPGRDIDE